MAYEASAELARKQYELAKGRAESARDLRLGTIGRNYLQGARSLEAGMEGRGILRSGEAMRRRVEYGAEEKAAREAAMQQGEYDVNQAALDYASELARLQGLGYSGATTTPEPEKPKEPAPAPRPAAPPATAPATGGAGGGTPSGGGSAQCQPTPKPGNPPLGYDYVWNSSKCAWELIALTSGGPAQPGMPAAPPGQGGVNEIGSGGRPIGTPPPNFVPVGTAPGALVGGPDRALANGGGVVDGIYIPPGINWAALGAAMSGGGGKVTKS